jgi:hypothetical protein
MDKKFEKPVDPLAATIEATIATFEVIRKAQGKPSFEEEAQQAARFRDELISEGVLAPCDFGDIEGASFAARLLG